MGYKAISAVGLLTMIAIAWALSENRRSIDWRLVAWALLLQVALGLIMWGTAAGDWFFEGVRSAFAVITESSNAGASFLFGNLTQVIVLNEGTVAGAEGVFLINAVLAFSVLPIVIFVSCLGAVLYHLRVIQFLVRIMARIMARTLGTSGAESFGSGLLVFFGIESMPVLRGYLNDMTRSELCTIMTVFMATVAADVMVIYANFGADAGHLLAASLMSAPAAILIAKVLVPETEQPQTLDMREIKVEVQSHNLIDAAARGASDGVHLALNIAGLLIAFVGLVFLLNLGLEAITGHTFTEVMGWLFIPFAFLLGIPMDDLVNVGQLLGKKTVLNEFLAYADMQVMIDAGTLSARSVTIATYALCGFANPGSLGILIACFAGLIPGRRSEFTQLGLKCFIGGTLAAFMTACIAGVLN